MAGKSNDGRTKNGLRVKNPNQTTFWALLNITNVFYVRPVTKKGLQAALQDIWYFCVTNLTLKFLLHLTVFAAYEH